MNLATVPTSSDTFERGAGRGGNISMKTYRVMVESDKVFDGVLIKEKYIKSLHRDICRKRDKTAFIMTKNLSGFVLQAPNCQ